MLVLDVEYDELERLAERMGATDQIAHEAGRAALKRVTRWANTRIRRAVAKEIGIAQSVLTKRHRFRLEQPRGRGMRAALWVGMNRLNAIHFNPRQVAGGVTSKKRSWPGAFIAQGRRGQRGPVGDHRQVYKRTGTRGTHFESGKPWDEVESLKVEIQDDVDRVLRTDVLRPLQREFLKHFVHELDYRMRIRGRG